MAYIAGHTFDGPGLDAQCIHLKNGVPDSYCRMTRATLFTATEADIDTEKSGMACVGKLTRHEYMQIQTDKQLHEKRVDAMMLAIRELSS